MIVIYVLIALVAGVTLFDYFAAGKWARVTSDARNEVVFEHRNQEYGAYVLRRDYNKVIMIIIASLILVLGSMAGTFYYYSNLPEEEEIIVKKDNSQFVQVAPPIEEDIPPPPKETPPPPMEERVAFTPPVVTNLPVEDPPFIQVDDAPKAGKDDQKGEVGFVDPPGGDPTPDPDPPKPVEPATFVEEEAEYNGGYAAMMAFIQKNLVYPQVAIENGIQGKCYLRFVVNLDGSISGVQVQRGVAGCPECDKAAMKVIREMPRWKPAKNGGKNTASYYSIPINFALE